MSSTIRYVLAVIGGVIVGSIVNMALIQASSLVIPTPPGTDVKTMEGLRAAMPLLEPRHFIFPFLAHALGTLAGAAVAAAVAPAHKLKFALAIGIFFLAGGIVSSSMLPAPAWFTMLDLLVAYIPMAWLGWRLGARAPMHHGAGAPRLGSVG